MGKLLLPVTLFRTQTYTFNLSRFFFSYFFQFVRELIFFLKDRLDFASPQIYASKIL